MAFDFFKNIKDKLEATATDLATIEQAMLREGADGEARVILYGRQQVDGDCVFYQSEEKVSKEELEFFSESLEASATARYGLGRAIIEIIT